MKRIAVGACVVALMVGSTGCASRLNSSLGITPVTTTWIARQNALRDGLESVQKKLMEQQLRLAGAIREGASRPDAAQLREYLDLQREQIDGLCFGYFQKLSEIDTGASWGQDQFNILAELGSVMLGLSGAPTEQLAALSGIQLGVNDSIDAVERAMLLSPDPHKVYQLVLNKQVDIAGQPTSFAAAERQVRAYAYACTPLGIRAIIDETLQEEIDRGTAGSQVEAVRATLDVVREKLGTEGDPVESLPDDVVSDLYWLFVLAPADQTVERDQIISRLPSGVRQPVTEALAKPEARQEIREHLVALGAQASWVSSTARRSREAFETNQRAVQLADAQRAAAEADRAATASRQQLVQEETARTEAAARLALAEAEKTRAETEAKRRSEDPAEGTRPVDPTPPESEGSTDTRP